MTLESEHFVIVFIESLSIGFTLLKISFILIVFIDKDHFSLSGGDAIRKGSIIEEVIGYIEGAIALWTPFRPVSNKVSIINGVFINL